MLEHSTTSTTKSANKDKSELNIFFEFLAEKTATVYEVEKAIGISRANGCRYKDYLEKIGFLQVVSVGKCPITRANNVQFVTTNHSLFLAKPLNLFQP